MTDDSQALPPELFAFYDGLAHNNTREFWATHKDRWEDFAQPPTPAIIRGPNSCDGRAR